MNLKKMRNQAVCEAGMISESVAVLYTNPSAEKVDAIFTRFNLIVGKVKIDYSPEEISDLFWGPMLSTLRRR